MSNKNPMKRQRKIDALKHAHLPGGFWTADEMKKLKGESEKGFSNSILTDSEWETNTGSLTQVAVKFIFWSKSDWSRTLRNKI